MKTLFSYERQNLFTELVISIENKKLQFFFRFLKKHEFLKNDNLTLPVDSQQTYKSDNSALLVNNVCGSTAKFFYDSNYNFYVKKEEDAKYFFDKYFTLLKNVNVNWMDLGSQGIEKVWKLNIDWLELIANTRKEKSYQVNDLVCLILPPIGKDLSSNISMLTLVAIDINKNKVVSLQQWGYWMENKKCIIDWLIKLAKIS